MTPTESLRQYLIGKFNTVFAAAHPSAPIRYENIRMDRLPNITEPVVYVADEPVRIRHMTLGKLQQRISGMLNVFCMAPEDSGTKAIREYADTTVEAFKLLDTYIPNVGYLRTRSISYDVITVYQSLYTIQVTISYECDLCP